MTCRLGWLAPFSHSRHPIIASIIFKSDSSEEYCTYIPPTHFNQTRMFRGIYPLEIRNPLKHEGPRICGPSDADPGSNSIHSPVNVHTLVSVSPFRISSISRAFSLICRWIAHSNRNISDFTSQETNSFNFKNISDIRDTDMSQSDMKDASNVPSSETWFKFLCSQKTKSLNIPYVRSVLEL